MKFASIEKIEMLLIYDVYGENKN